MLLLEMDWSSSFGLPLVLESSSVISIDMSTEAELVVLLEMDWSS